MLVKIDLPPGLYRNGTAYSGMGRWRDGSLIRFQEGSIGPVGGWLQRSVGEVVGSPRALMTLRANNGASWAIIGTNSKLYAMNKGGTLSDITPDGFTVGRVDATHATGYGVGPYGAGGYGTPRPGSQTVLDSTVWSLDTWGEFPVGVSPDDGVLYQWDLDPAHPAVPIANAPSALATVVTAERIQMALGADGDPRSVAWSDQENNTVWTDAEENQAGSFPLQTSGQLMCGRRVTGGTLLLTDLDCWLAEYVGFPLVYGFVKQGEDCGLISRGALAVTGSQAVWMGERSFFVWNGMVSALPCDVSDYVFGGLNRSQKSKIAAWHNSEFGEVWWFYPDANHVQNNSYVAWSYRENHWSFGKLNRTCGAPKGSFPHPMAMTSEGAVFDHEVGSTRTGVPGIGVPYLVSSPMELGGGDLVVTVRGMVADSSAAADLTATLVSRFEPNGAASPHGPFALAARTDFMFSGRQVEVTFTEARQRDWRLGKPRLDVVSRGKR